MEANDESALTSAPKKDAMLMPLKSPKTIDTMIMTTEMEKIDERRAMSRKCDQPGVVGENESCEKKAKVSQCRGLEPISNAEEFFFE